MATVRLDSRITHNPRVVQLSNSAFRLHISALCWTAENQTAGVIPANALLPISGIHRHRSAARELVNRGLWNALPSGDYQVRHELFSIDREPVYATGQRERIYERDGHRCVTCGATEDLTLDHIHPRSYAGNDDDTNLRTLCRPCNSRKGARV